MGRDSSYEYFIAGHWPDINNPKVSELDLKFSTSRFYSSHVCGVGGRGERLSANASRAKMLFAAPHLCPRTFTLIVNIILSNYATSERLCLKGGGGGGVGVVWLRHWRIGCRLRRRSRRVRCREFVLTCSRWQFSSNRLDYAPHLSTRALPDDSREFAIRGARDCTRAFVWSNFARKLSISLIVKEARVRGESAGETAIP